MTVRSAVLVAAVAPALLFTPVFGMSALLVPLLLVLAVGVAVGEVCERRPGLVPWRPLLVLVLGLLALTEALLFPTTVFGLPTGETVRALLAGVTDSWQLTLQSTWPARPTPDLLLFVPLAALVAATLALELARWPLVALLPGVAVLCLSQAYVALTGWTAVLVAFGFAVPAAVALASTRATTLESRRPWLALVLVAPTLVMAVAGALVAAVVDPVDKPSVSLRDKQFAPLPPDRVANPLDEIPERLKDPEAEVFRYTTDDPVDRWRLVALDSFDGVTWTPSTQPRRLGTTLAPPVDVPKTTHSARIEYPRTDDPWLPSQALPASVSGLDPYVDETSGVLLAYHRTGPVDYELTWYEPDPGDLRGAAIDPAARTGYGDLGEVPPGIAELARTAVADTRPAFQTALVLERYLRANYRLAEGPDQPGGSGWHQLEEFLLDSHVGTAQQFAAAYVVLARHIGLPARMAVGYRAPESTGGEVVVRNKDVLAWPEVAVAGVGWVPLDPTGATSASGGKPKGLAEATAEAREQLPPAEEVKDPELPPDDQSDGAADGTGDFVFPWAPVSIGLAALVVLWLGGVPLVRAVRAWRRRRRPGAAAVVGAWAEARDRLRAHGVPFTKGMTVRDLAAATDDPLLTPGLNSLARTVDVALWSARGPAPTTTEEAWTAVRAVRDGLAKRPFADRLKATLNPWTLLPPR